jgi:hypothetical protein
MNELWKRDSNGQDHSDALSFFPSEGKKSRKRNNQKKKQKKRKKGTKGVPGLKGMEKRRLHPHEK